MPTIPDFEAQHRIVVPRVTGAENYPTHFKIFNAAGEEIGYCRSISVERTANHYHDLGNLGVMMPMPDDVRLTIRGVVLNRPPDLNASERYTIKVQEGPQTEFRGCYLTSYTYMNSLADAGHCNCEEMTFVVFEAVEAGHQIYNGNKAPSQKTIEWLERWTKR